MLKNKIIIPVIIIMAASAGIYSAMQTIRPACAQIPAPANIIVGADQLKEAGFNNAAIQSAEAGKFLQPVFYFRVKETVPGDQGKTWGDSANLVAVLVQPVSDTSWVYNNGQMEEVDLSGRTQANLSSAGYFISVIGPDKQKVETLAHNLKVLY